MMTLALSISLVAICSITSSMSSGSRAALASQGQLTVSGRLTASSSLLGSARIRTRSACSLPPRPTSQTSQVTIQRCDIACAPEGTGGQ